MYCLWDPRGHDESSDESKVRKNPENYAKQDQKVGEIVDASSNQREALGVNMTQQGANSVHHKGYNSVRFLYHL